MKRYIYLFCTEMGIEFYTSRINLGYLPKFSEKMVDISPLPCYDKRTLQITFHIMTQKAARGFPQSIL